MQMSMPNIRFLMLKATVRNLRYMWSMLIMATRDMYGRKMSGNTKAMTKK